MRRFIDYFSIRLIIFIASFIAISFIAKKFYIALLAALGITIALSIILDLIMRKKTAQHMLYSQFLQRAIIGGNEYVIDLVLATLGVTSYRQESNYITTHYRGDDIIIINSIKFGIITPDELLRHQQLCRSKNIKECYLLARIVDRRCLAIGRHLDDFNIHLITTKQLYRLAMHRAAINKNTLLDKEQAKRDITKFNFGDLMQIIFAHRNSSRYLLTAGILAFMSIFTPLRTYYLVMSAITLLLAALCLLPFSDYNSPTRMGIFSKRNASEEQSMRKSLTHTLQLMQPYPTNAQSTMSVNDSRYDIVAQSTSNNNSVTDMINTNTDANLDTTPSHYSNAPNPSDASNAITSAQDIACNASIKNNIIAQNTSISNNEYMQNTSNIDNYDDTSDDNYSI